MQLRRSGKVCGLNGKQKCRLPISSEKSEVSRRDPSPLINALLQRKGGPEELAAALANKKLPPDAAKVALRTLDASGRQIPALSEALTKAGGLTSGPRELSADEMKALVAEVAVKGNAHRGEAIYRRKELNCLKCHAIGGAGGRVGPDMLSLGSSAQIDYIAESLLAPNDSGLQSA